MESADGWTVELEVPAALEDAIEDGLSEIFVVEDAAPGFERLVGRKEHGAFPTVAVVDDVEENVGGIGAVGEVADFVDDEDVGMRVGGQGVGSCSWRMASPQRISRS